MDRQEYLRQMYLKNRGIETNTISDLAYLNTANDTKNSTYTTNNLNLDNEIDASSNVNSIDKGNWIDRTASTLDQIGYNVVDGALNSFEGITDLLTLGAGWIGSWFGIDDQWAKDAASYDWSKDITDFMGKYSDTFMPWNWNGEKMNEIWNSDYQERTNTQSWTSENETVSEWTTNISQMVGNMLPSIALTVATAGAYTGAQAGSVAAGLTTASQVADKANKIGKWAGLLEMGISAAGQSSTEAVEEGASTGSALLYGALSGAVEIGTEMIGGDTIAGIALGGSTGSLGKNLAKAFVSEGVEEVMSDLVSPLVDLTYKNNSSWEEAINYLNETYTSSEFGKGLIDSFVMGGIGGLIFGGTSELTNYKKLGKTGYAYVNTANEIVEVKENLIKANQNGDAKKVSKYEAKLNDLGNKLSSLAEAIGDNVNIQKRIASQMNDYVEFSKIENELNNSLSDINEETTKKYTEAFNNLTESYKAKVDLVEEKINDFTEKVLNKYGIKVDVEFKENLESETGRQAQYQNGHIVIDNKYKNNLEPLLTHETGHAITEKMDAKSVDEIYNRMVSQKVSNQFEEKIKNTEAYKNATSEEAKQDIIKKETISYYLENIVEKGGDSKNIYLETSLIKKLFEPSFYNEFKTNNEIRKELNNLAKKSKYARNLANKYFKGEYSVLASMTKYSKEAQSLLNELVEAENINATDKNILKEIIRSGNSKVYAKETQKVEKETKKNKKNDKKENPKFAIGLALTYDDSYSLDEFISGGTKEDIKKIAKRNVSKLAKDLGIEVEYHEGLGGWAFTDNANARQVDGELSFPVKITNYKNIEDVKIFACVLADTAYEVQNAVGLFEYDDKGKDTEVSIPLKLGDNANDIKQAIIDAGIDYYTLDDNNTLRINVSNDEYAEETLKKIKSLITILKNRGVINGKASQQQTRNYFFEPRDRENIYRTWLGNRDSERNERLFHRVQEAEEITSGLIELFTDDKGNRKKGTPANSVQLLKEIRKARKEIAKSSNVNIIKTNTSPTKITIGDKTYSLSKKNIPAINAEIRKLENKIKSIDENTGKEISKKNAKLLLEWKENLKTYKAFVEKIKNLKETSSKLTEKNKELEKERNSKQRAKNRAEEKLRKVEEKTSKAIAEKIEAEKATKLAKEEEIETKKSTRNIIFDSKKIANAIIENKEYAKEFKGKMANSVKTGDTYLDENGKLQFIYKSARSNIDANVLTNFEKTYKLKLESGEITFNETEAMMKDCITIVKTIHQLYERVATNSQMWNESERLNKFYNYLSKGSTLEDTIKFLNEVENKINTLEKGVNYLADSSTIDKIIYLYDKYLTYRKIGALSGIYKARIVDNQIVGGFNSDFNEYDYATSLANVDDSIRLTPEYAKLTSQYEIKSISKEIYKIKTGSKEFNNQKPLTRLDLDIDENQFKKTGVSVEALDKFYKIVSDLDGTEKSKEYTQLRRNLIREGTTDKKNSKDVKLKELESKLLKEGNFEAMSKLIQSKLSFQDNGTETTYVNYLKEGVDRLIKSVENYQYKNLVEGKYVEETEKLYKLQAVVHAINNLVSTNKVGKTELGLNAFIVNNYLDLRDNRKNHKSPFRDVKFEKLEQTINNAISKVEKDLPTYKIETKRKYVKNYAKSVFSSYAPTSFVLNEKNLGTLYFFKPSVEEIEVNNNIAKELGNDAPLIPTEEFNLEIPSEKQSEEFIELENEAKREEIEKNNAPEKVGEEDSKEASKKIMTENVSRDKKTTLKEMGQNLYKLTKDKGYVKGVMEWLRNNPTWLKFQKQWVNSQVYFERAVEKFGFNQEESSTMTFRLRSSNKIASYLVSEGFEVEETNEKGETIKKRVSIKNAYKTLTDSVLLDKNLTSKEKTTKLKQLKNDADLYIYNLYAIDNNNAPVKRLNYFVDTLLQDEKFGKFLEDFGIVPDTLFENTYGVIGKAQENGFKEQVFVETLNKAIQQDVQELKQTIETICKENGISERKLATFKMRVEKFVEPLREATKVKTVFGQIVDKASLEKINLEVLEEFSPELVEGIKNSLNDNGFVWSEDIIDYNKDAFGENEEVYEEYKKLKKMVREFTNKELEKTNQELLKKSPIIKEYQKQIRQYLDLMLDYRTQKGLITEETRDMLRELYPNYAPTYREQISFNGSSKLMKGVNTQNSIRERKGNNELISPLIQSIVDQTRSAVKKGIVNDICNQIDTRSILNGTRNVESDIVLDTEEKAIPKIYSMEELLTAIDDLTPAEKENNNIHYFKKVEGELIDKKMTLTNDAMQAFSLVEDESKFDNFIFARALKSTMRLFGNLITSYNPFFVLRNATRDFGDAILTTQNSAKDFITQYGKSYIEIVKNSEMYNFYRSLGGGVFDNYSGDAITQITDNITQENKKFNKYNPIKKFAYINEIVEQAPRFTEFKLSYEKYIKQGMNKVDASNLAMLDSARITTDFSRGGTWGKSLNRTLIPFLNAQIQGAAKVSQFVKNSWLTLSNPKDKKEFVSLLAKLLLLGIAPELLSWLLNLGNEDYEALPEYTKANYLLIPIGNGNFIKIPRGRILGTVNNTVYQAIEMAKGNKDLVEASKDWLDVASTNLSPVDLGSGIRTIFSPITDVMNNTTWYGQSIDNTSDLNKYGRQRYDASTSEVAKAIGNIFNYSPKRIDYLLDSYTGVVGDFVLPLTTKSSNPSDALLNFITSNTSVSSVKNSKYRGESYDLLENLLYEKNAGNNIASVQYNYLKRALDDIADLQEAVNNAKTKAEQYTAYLTLREAYKTSIENTKLISEKLKGVSNEDIDTTDRYTMTEIYRQIFGAEYALKYYSSNLTSKITVAKQLGISYENFYQAYFGVKQVSTTTEANVIVERLGGSYYGKLYLKSSLGLSLTNAEKTKLEKYLKSRKLV